MDHSYHISTRKTRKQARRKISVQPTVSESSQPLTQASVSDKIISIKPLFEHDWSGEINDEEESAMQDPDGLDSVEYIPQSDEKNLSDHEIYDAEETIYPDIGRFENNYLVFEICLDKLHKFVKNAEVQLSQADDLRQVVALRIRSSVFENTSTYGTRNHLFIASH